MPGFDGTGPAGMGPMTGGGRGWCNPYAGGYGPSYPAPQRPYYAAPPIAYGFGRPWWGLGRGFYGGRGGWRWRDAVGGPGWARFGYAPDWEMLPGACCPYIAPPTPQQQTVFLRMQAEWLQQQLDAIGQRIAELEREK